MQDNSLTSSMQMNAKTQVLPMRPDSQVMQLERLGSFHQSRLSFMRTLVRRMVTENWQITSPVFDLDDQGYGTVVYQVEARFGTFSYVLFSHYLVPYTHLRAHETVLDLVCRLLLEKKNNTVSVSLSLLLPHKTNLNIVFLLLLSPTPTTNLHSRHSTNQTIL